MPDAPDLPALKPFIVHAARYGAFTILAESEEALNGALKAQHLTEWEDFSISAWTWTLEDVIEGAKRQAVKRQDPQMERVNALSVEGAVSPTEPAKILAVQDVMTDLYGPGGPLTQRVQDLLDALTQEAERQAAIKIRQLTLPGVV